MKKIIIFTSLLIITHSHHSLCMKSTVKNANSAEPVKHRSMFDDNIFACLNWHNSPFDHTVNMCDAVEKLVKKDPTIVTKKQINGMSPYDGMYPMDVAIQQKCPRCVVLLLQNGASYNERKLRTYGYVISHPETKTTH